MLPKQVGASAAYTFGLFGLKGTYEDYASCFPRLAKLGFHNYSLEILEDEHEAMFTPERVDHFRKLGEQYGIGLSIFTIYHAENDLVSLSPDRRQSGLRKFRFGVEAAARLGSTLVNMASEFPPELVQEYRPEYVHAPAGTFSIPPKVSWESIWKAQVEVMQACADMAADRGMRFSLEPRANCLISTSDSFLRLADHVDRPNFGCTLDLLHAAFHREDIPTSIKKLGPLLTDLQVSDADGQTLKHLPLGQGSIDFPAVIRALDEIGFEGIMALEILVGDIDEGYLHSRLALEKFLEK